MRKCVKSRKVRINKPRINNVAKPMFFEGDTKDAYLY
jgi:hypothetical protein